MRGRLWCGLLCLLIGGCTATSNVTVTPEQEAARKAWHDCVVDAVIRLDDGHSDPMSIANGIEPVCGVQYNTLTQLEVNHFTTQAEQDNMRQLMKTNELKGITSAILINRSKHNARVNSVPWGPSGDGPSQTIPSRTAQ